MFFSALIFVLLGSEDGFSREWVRDDTGVLRAPSMYNGAFTTVAFLLGSVTSIASGFLGGSSVQSGGSHLTPWSAIRKSWCYFTRISS